MPSFMEVLVSRNCARSCQLNQRHTLHLHPPSSPQKLPDGLEGGWIFQAMPEGPPLPCQRAQMEPGSILHRPDEAACLSWGPREAACLSGLLRQAQNMFFSAYEASLFNFIL